MINKCKIKPGYKSDHSFIALEIIQNKITIGKGIWKFNNNLLRNEDHIELINKIMDNQIYTYAIPVYHLIYLKGNYKDILFKVDDYLQKTVKMVQDRDGQFITEQDILEYMKNFYENLFSNKDDTLENVSLKEILKNANLHKVSDNKLGDPLPGQLMPPSKKESCQQLSSKE